MMNEIRLTAQKERSIIEFDLTEKAQVELFIHQLGKQHNGEYYTQCIAQSTMCKGAKRIMLHRTKLASGTYLYELKVNRFVRKYGRIVVE